MSDDYKGGSTKHYISITTAKNYKRGAIWRLPPWHRRSYQSFNNRHLATQMHSPQCCRHQTEQRWLMLRICCWECHLLLLLLVLTALRKVISRNMRIQSNHPRFSLMRRGPRRRHPERASTYPYCNHHNKEWFTYSSTKGVPRANNQ